MLTLLMTILLILVKPFAWAQDERRQHALWTECRNVRMQVAYEPAKHASTPYPTEESIRAIISSRLRAARLLYEDSWQISGLSISIRSAQDEPDNILNELVLISFGFHKEMHDSWTDTYRYVPVWSREGTVGVSRLREAVSELVDLFLDEYLRVNEPACRKKPLPKTLDIPAR